MLNLFIDSAERADVERLLATGAFAGATTNPAILAKSGLGVHDLPDVYAWLRAAGARRIFLQAWADAELSLLARARQLLEYGDDVVVKIPFTYDGVSVASQLVAEGRPVLLTVIHTAPQAMVAGAVGVEFVAPYVGRMSDAGRLGIDRTSLMAEALRAVSSPTKVLAASIRDQEDVVALAAAGVCDFALPVRIIDAIFSDDLTTAALAAFDDAVAASPTPTGTKGD